MGKGITLLGLCLIGMVCSTCSPRHCDAYVIEEEKNIFVKI